MSRQSFIIASILLTVFSTSCWKTIELEPVSFPQLLSDEIRVVKAFDNGMFLAGGETGFYARFTDEIEVTHKLKSREFEDWSVNTMEFLINSDNVIYGVGGDYVMKLSTSAVDFFEAKTDAINSFKSYTIDSEDNLVMADYWSADNVNGVFVYKVRLNKWQNGSWEGIETDITISDAHLDNPELVLHEDGSLILLTNPVYKINGLASGHVEYEKYIPNIEGTDQVRSINDAHTDGQSFFGFDRELSEEWDVSRAYTFSLNSGLWKSTSLQEGSQCEVSNTTFRLTKLLAAIDTKSYGWIPVINNSFSNSPGLIGYMVVYDHSRSSCEVQSVMDEEAFDKDVTIHDMSYLSSTGELLVATSNGLYAYDFETSSARFYLQSIFDLE